MDSVAFGSPTCDTPSHLTQTVTPVVEDSVLHVDANGSQARVQSTFPPQLHYRKPLAKHRSGTRPPRTGARRLLGQKLFNGGRGMNNASFACPAT